MFSRRVADGQTRLAISPLIIPTAVTSMPLDLSRLKFFLRWLIVGGTLFFLAQALITHWAEVKNITLQPGGILYITLALLIILLGHTWAGYVWGLILISLNQKNRPFWAIRVYLRTNIAKYLPGNVWHYYGRISAAKAENISFSAATVSVIIESLLMATSALLIAMFGSQTFWAILPDRIKQASIFGLFGLCAGLLVIHPLVFNAVIKRGQQLQAKITRKSPSTSNAPASQGFVIHRYPLRPFLGEFIFLSIRATGFIWVVMAFHSLSFQQLPLVYTAFSLAWFLGLIVPGAPGGIGVFESAALAMLQPILPSGIILSSVALYRVISIIAEATGAGLVWLYEAFVLKKPQ